ncbi:MAG: DUF1553 domain-containing protein [Planctomycetia bacterium]|nr:DUF1553 domain-containing protein [Planctomycetia bacterium]
MQRNGIIALVLLSAAFLWWIVNLAAQDRQPDIDFNAQIKPIFQQHCYQCHGEKKQKSSLRLDQRDAALQGGDLGKAIVPGQSDRSSLYRYVAGLEPDMIMPPKGARLSKDELQRIRQWIDQGAAWPEDKSSKPAEIWWSLKPLSTPPIPKHSEEGSAWSKRPIDSFIWDKLQKQQLKPSSQADKRTLIRRLKFDLLGLPPTPEEVDRFLKDTSPDAYAKQVDEYLASPRYGERWARHWLDIVHYGETHGYDKDQPRPNAWPYRDYVIRAFNEDKPYSRFVEEQIAGDVLYPYTHDGIEALGFLSAGPWDFIGHVELPETKIDGKIARHLDRDDMVANTINTFQSTTVHCAQCHQHKFDPIPTEDYYRLQAVFAAIDRTDKAYDKDPTVARQREKLQLKLAASQMELQKLHQERSQISSPELEQLKKQIAELKQQAGNSSPAYGYHSQLAKKANTEKWVQLDLKEPIAIRKLELIGCYDDFNQIGPGFGFPRRYRITASLHEDMRDSIMLVDRTAEVQPNPGTMPVAVDVNANVRYLRLTATELAHRQNDYHLSLAEWRVFNADGENVSLKATVTSLDSIEAGPRWLKTNLIDGIVPKPLDLHRVRQLELKLQALHRSLVPASITERIALHEKQISDLESQLKTLPAQSKVYSGTVHFGQGNFKGTAGTPRPIYLLTRGNVTRPGKEVQPGSMSMLKHMPAAFDLPKAAPEGERRAALARWLVHRDNPLTWRSIVNRVWLYHFTQGLVETPNDFGRMGQKPSHPELLDWLADDFRKHGSFKKLHRLIVTSAVYQQTSQVSDETLKAITVDSGNRLLWRMNRRRLEAEALRDSVLQTAGKLDLTMGGPSYQDYVVEKPEHSPHYQYELKDPNDPKLHRRAIYRSIVRSQQNPWMATMDCADPSILVDKRNQTVSPLQALALLNDPLLLVMSRHFAEQLQQEKDIDKQIEKAMQWVLQRAPTPTEAESLKAYVEKHGIVQLGRLLWNLNEFTFVD